MKNKFEIGQEVWYHEPSGSFVECVITSVTQYENKCRYTKKDSTSCGSDIVSVGESRLFTDIEDYLNGLHKRFYKDAGTGSFPDDDKHDTDCTGDCCVTLEWTNEHTEALKDEWACQMASTRNKANLPIENKKEISFLKKQVNKLLGLDDE